MDIADWNGLDFRRRLASADRFNDCAMRRALDDVNTPGSRSSASLVLETAPDHRCTRVAASFFRGLELRAAFLLVVVLADFVEDFRRAITASSSWRESRVSHHRPAALSAVDRRSCRSSPTL